MYDNMSSINDIKKSIIIKKRCAKKRTAYIYCFACFMDTNSS